MFLFEKKVLYLKKNFAVQGIIAHLLQLSMTNRLLGSVWFCYFGLLHILVTSQCLWLSDITIFATKHTIVAYVALSFSWDSSIADHLDFDKDGMFDKGLVGVYWAAGLW